MNKKDLYHILSCVTMFTLFVSFLFIIILFVPCLDMENILYIRSMEGTKEYNITLLVSFIVFFVSCILLPIFDRHYYSKKD